MPTPIPPFDWAATPWQLRIDNGPPGLYRDDPTSGPLLSLESLSAIGRATDFPFAQITPYQLETRGPRIEVTYRPEGWGSLRVTAAWTPRDDSTVDLDIEIETRDFERLRGFELTVLSRLTGELAPGAHRSVSPRDRRSAGYTYDGRESDLDALVTGPPGEPLGPWLAPKSGRDGWTYIEMAHPDDVSRRIHEGSLPFRATRHALFGHDLERGVVLRARMRGVWLRKEEAHSQLETRWREFLDRPLPLTT